MTKEEYEKIKKSLINCSSNDQLQDGILNIENQELNHKLQSKFLECMSKNKEFNETLDIVLYSLDNEYKADKNQERTL